jgi:hypothetical protein
MIWPESQVYKATSKAEYFLVKSSSAGLFLFSLSNETQELVGKHLCLERGGKKQLSCLYYKLHVPQICHELLFYAFSM